MRRRWIHLRALSRQFGRIADPYIGCRRRRLPPAPPHGIRGAKGGGLAARRQPLRVKMLEIPMHQTKTGPGGDPPPRARRNPERRETHGVEWIDDYAWLRAGNWREVLREPEKLPAPIREHLEAENAYGARLLAPVKGLRRELVREMRARLKEDDSEAPQSDGAYAYYARYRRGGQHRIYCRTQREGGKETILLDGDGLAAGKTFFNLFDARHAPDHAKVAWSCDDKGSELFTIRVREIASSLDLPDQVENSA